MRHHLKKSIFQPSRPFSFKNNPILDWGSCVIPRRRGQEVELLKMSDMHEEPPLAVKQFIEGLPPITASLDFIFSSAPDDRPLRLLGLCEKYSHEEVIEQALVQLSSAENTALRDRLKSALQTSYWGGYADDWMIRYEEGIYQSLLKEVYTVLVLSSCLKRDDLREGELVWEAPYAHTIPVLQTQLPAKALHITQESMKKLASLKLLPGCSYFSENANSLVSAIQSAKSEDQFVSFAKNLKSRSIVYGLLLAMPFEVSTFYSFPLSFSFKAYDFSLLKTGKELVSLQECVEAINVSAPNALVCG